MSDSVAKLREAISGVKLTGREREAIDAIIEKMKDAPKRLRCPQCGSDELAVWVTERYRCEARMGAKDLGLSRYGSSDDIQKMDDEMECDACGHKWGHRLPQKWFWE